MAEDTSKQRGEKHFQIKRLLHHCHAVQPFWKGEREPGKLFCLEETTLSSQRGSANAWPMLAPKPALKVRIKETPRGKKPGSPSHRGCAAPRLLLVIRIPQGATSSLGHPAFQASPVSICMKDARVRNDQTNWIILHSCSSC